jgi:hypothetical protein
MIMSRLIGYVRIIRFLGNKGGEEASNEENKLK